MSNHDELIAQFIEISGGDENVARFYLSSSDWSLETALGNFLGNQTDNETDVPVAPRRSAGKNPDPDSAKETSTTATGSSSARSVTNDSDNFPTGSYGKPRIGTLNDMNRRTSSDEEGQAFYAGGSERSGQQVLGPPKRKNFREQLTDMFRMAQEQSSGDSDAPPTPSTSRVHWGQGVRLGMTDSDHTVVGASGSAATAKKESDPDKPIVMLKLWSQGFSIDDGELRLYDDPDNKEFLETVMRGEIPPELLEMGWMVNVDVEDHRHEDYKKPAPVKSFKGSGHALGSPTPNIVGIDDVKEPNTAAENTATTEKTAKEKLNTDTAAPTTTLQIRLADGSRLAAQFNLTHTVGDIHRYIQSARPQYAESSFILVSSFPTRELTDQSATIQCAGLKNAALMQRLK